MLHKTKGIVLKTIKYKDTSIIVKIFTRELGLKTYIVNGVRKKTKNNKIALYQALSILDLVVYENEKTDIQRISDASFHYQASSIPFEVKKSAIALFIAELLHKVLEDHESLETLFDFLEQTIRSFDQQEEHYSDFHLILMLHLLDYLGHAYMVDDEHIVELKKGISNQEGNRKERKNVLDDLLIYYREQGLLHGELKSLAVLQSIFV